MTTPEPVQFDKDGIPLRGTGDTHVWVLDPTITEPVEDPARAELRSFFRSLGAGARRRVRRVLPTQVSTRIGLVAGALALAFAALAANSWAHSPPDDVPLELQAAWGTTTPSYADRQFWIGKHQIAFQVGPSRSDVAIFPIAAISRQRRGDTTDFRIEYGRAGETSVFAFKHTQLPQPRIVFLHQATMVWSVIPDLHPPVK
jgi:hypothetical protein